MLAWGLAAALALSTPGVAAATPAPERPAAIPSPPVAHVASVPVPVAGLPLPGWGEVASVPPDVRMALRDGVVGAGPGARRLERLVDWMFASDGLAFEYDNATTRTVAETLRDRRGNCLSFTLTFVELARQAGLDAYVQETDDVLVWPGDVDSNLVMHAGHVNAGVDVGSRHYTVDFEPGLTLGRHHPRQIGDGRALAHFLNNRGVEWLEHGDPVEALRHFDASVALEPGFVPGLNNIGVTRNRLGDTAAAEQAYLGVLEVAPRHLPALSNLVNLYRQRGDTGRLVRHERRLARIERRDPYRNFVIGLQHERQGDYEAALAAYRRSIRLHRNEPQFHLAMARVHALLGDPREAGRRWEIARAMKGRPADTRGPDPFEDRFRPLPDY